MHQAFAVAATAPYGSKNGHARDDAADDGQHDGSVDDHLVEVDDVGERLETIDVQKPCVDGWRTTQGDNTKRQQCRPA